MDMPEEIKKELNRAEALEKAGEFADAERIRAWAEAELERRMEEPERHTEDY